jgi:hypothetical protein
MKEMNHIHAIYQGGSVKKTLFVVALATMLVFAVAGSAFAVNHSGQQRLGKAAPADAFGYDALGNFVNITGAGTNTYVDWNKSLGSNATNGNSPHGNYTTTTVKCAVCHAVHYAGNGAPVGGGTPGNDYTVASGNQSADTLLRVKASDACIFCHATTGQAVNGRPVYDGLGPAIGNGGTPTTGHVVGTNCSFCHTNVHGANADDSVASLQGYLLKLLPQAAVTEMFDAPTSNMIEAITAIDHQAENQGYVAGAALAGTIGDYASDNSSARREVAVGVFCAECHNGAYATGAPGAATNVMGSGGATGVSYSGHRIAAGVTLNWNADGSKSSGLVQNQQIAWAAANNCKSCHDAVDSLGNTAFPHAWGRAVDAPAASHTKMWLTSAADAGALTENVPAGDYNVERTQLSDGVCLKCHVASGGAAGVGITF